MTLVLAVRCYYTQLDRHVRLSPLLAVLWLCGRCFGSQWLLSIEIGCKLTEYIDDIQQYVPTRFRLLVIVADSF